MPRYRNESNRNIEIGNLFLKPQEEKVSLVLYENLPMNIIKTSDSPLFNNIILSEVYNSNITFKIPPKITRYYVHFYVAKGNAIVYLQNKNNNPPLKLYTNSKWNLKYIERLVDTFIIELTEGGEVWVIVEHT